jgi:gluconate 2-dehydrogenase alpha chain
MVTLKEPVDAVLIGFGWTAAILAEELTRESLKVLALERGGKRDTVPDFSPAFIQDELRFAIRHEMFQEPARETLTFRNTASQAALPMRRLGSFMPGTGVGGAGVHWNGQCWRFLPSDFEIRSHYTERYGAGVIPAGMTIQDWGVTYQELEPFYEKFEYLCGVSGQAGNVAGKLLEGGNPFEGERSRGYPLPPLERTYGTVLFDRAAREAGFHPFPAPAANTSRPYRNPLGVQMGECSYCGYCEWFRCGNYSKSSPQTTIHPVLEQRENFELRTQCNVTRILLDNTGRRATGVRYVDVDGEETEQPAELVIVCAYSLHCVRLMLLSGIGQPYDPRTKSGTIGRNYAYQITSSVTVTFDGEILNPFIGAGALGQAIDDFNGDNFDHGPLGFVGGGYHALWTTGARPIGTFQPSGGSSASWGAEWKKMAKQVYLRSADIVTHGSVMSYEDAYLDLDPTYEDIYGQPLLRMTFDFHENEHKMSDFLTDKAKIIAQAMRPASIDAQYRRGHYSIVPYQTTHNTGGTIMGSGPTTSAVNRYLQSWDVPNVFVMGASVFPQNAG